MIISTLLTIKTVRLERSKQAVDQQMLTVQAARYRYQQSVEEQQAFAQWRIAEETRLFEACKARVLDQHGLTQWQQRVAELRCQQARREELVAEQQACLVREQECYQQCRQRYRLAQQQTEKFQQLSQHGLEEKKRLLEYQEEQELEEYRP